MKIEFHPAAVDEFDQARQYYDTVEPGLGLEFVVEVYDAIQRAAAYPRAYETIAEDVRRSLVRRFPFGVLYAEMVPEGLFILAVMHLHRVPNYWQQRRKPGTLL